jgi:hypothetical protein
LDSSLHLSVMVFITQVMRRELVFYTILNHVGYLVRVICYCWRSMNSGWCLWSLNSLVRVKVKVTLRLEVYHQSVRLGVKPLESHDQTFFQLNLCGNSPYVTSSLTKRWASTLRVKIRVRVTLRLVVYTQSVLLGDKPLETHDQQFFSTEHFRS